MSTIIIKARLVHDQDFLFKCIIKLYELQELDEADAKNTLYTNGVGFNKADAPAMTKFAEDILEHESISNTRHAYAAEVMLKYANQLSKILSQEEIEN